MILSWAKSWNRFSPSRSISKGRRRSQARHRRPQLELLEDRTLLDSGTWTQLTSAIPDTVGAGTMVLLTDGTVMVQGGEGSPAPTAKWYELTPSSTGSYINGTWTTLASMNTARMFFAANVVQNGNLFVEGGEYSGRTSRPNWTDTGEIYNPIANTWTKISPNFPQTQFGDDPSTLLDNGLILTGYIAGPQTYFYNPTSSTIVDNGISVSPGTWALAATKQASDWGDEEGWVKMGNGDILSYDVGVGGSPTTSSAQYYDPSSNTWTATPNLSVFLTDNTNYELGPGLLLPNGNVFYLGGGTVSGGTETYNPSGSANTAIYNPSLNTWTAGPVIPNHQAADDAPAAMLPTGQVLFAADTEYGNSPSTLYLYDPNSNTISAVTSEPSGLSSVLNSQPAFHERMLVLPTGQVMLALNNQTIWVYTPSGTTNSNVPAVSGVTNSGGGNYVLTGTQLNGQSAGAAYGDDAEMDENYPVVYLTSGSNVYWARTTNWSTTGVQTGSTSETVDFSLPTTLSVGNYTLYVTGAGLTSTGTAFNVQDSTTTTVSSSLNPANAGQSVTFTATVSSTGPFAGGGTVTGTATFLDGSATLGTGTLNGSGQATFTTSSLTPGNHTITVVYGGDTNYIVSTSTALNETISSSNGSTTTTLASSSISSVFGQAVTFTATVSSGSGTPTGTVTFEDGTTSLGTGALNGGVATFSTSSLTVGVHSITAVYGGDSNFTGSTSAVLTQTVNKDGSTTVAVASVNPSVFGQNVTFTATVTANGPGAGTPTGTVIFKNAATTLGTATLLSGSASFTTSGLGVGTRGIEVVYTGNANFTASTDSALKQTVNRDGSTTVAVSSVNPTVFGQSVTFTATVSASAPGSGTPTGTVIFKNGSTTLGTATLTAGSTSFTTSGLGVGTRGIEVVYTGDSNFTASTDSALKQTVNRDGSATVLASSTNPSTSGQAVTFTATVTASAPGSGTATGTVIFKTGATTLGSGTLSGGQATFTTSTLSVGTDKITAVYQGDANFKVSNSATLTQTVNAAGSVLLATVGLADRSSSGAAAPARSDPAVSAPALDYWRLLDIDEMSHAAFSPSKSLSLARLHDGDTAAFARMGFAGLDWFFASNPEIF